MSKFKVKTPHAAVLVWNYNDRVGAPTGNEYNSTGVVDPIGTEKDVLPVIISTLSCVSIQTSKSKSQPDGRFNLVLAPFKNWVSNLTAGSWCAILMSNEPIKEADLSRANPNQVKMIGRIESVRCETQAAEDGTRQTLYYVTGVDWGHIFNSILYIDNLIAAPNDPKTQGNMAAVAIRNALFGKKGSPESFTVAENLTNLLDIMGKDLGGYTKVGNEIGRLSNTIYEFTIPEQLTKFLDLKDSKGAAAKAINKGLTLTVGSLYDKHKYDDPAESVGFLDPFSLQGTHSIWQILLENSNPALNEMFCELDWDKKLELRIYNRIKPFSFKGFKPKAGQAKSLKSYFQFIKTHKLDAVDIISVNAGTNWRDKFNFIEIKPQFQDFAIVANWYKQKSQVFDPESFKREGFRPLIVDTKQFPAKKGQLPTDAGIQWDQLEVWAKLMREWYFDTHRMLNGTITLQGSTEYIAVGNNIMFDAGLLNPTPNINKKTRDSGKNHYIMAHVENVSHSFGVSPDGARTYRTTIQFVRGIVTYENGELVGDGMLDQNATLVTQAEDRNSLNVNSTSDILDPDPQKVRGT